MNNTYEFKVDGMTCGGCVAAVSRALKGLDPQAEVSVDLKAQTVRVKSREKAEALQASIVEAGYPVLNTRSVVA